MNWQAILIPGLIIGGLGAFFATVLGIVSRIFHVEKEECVEAVSSALPGLNCGGCGFPSCEGYAVALCEDESISLSACKPGGSEATEKIAAALGRESGGAQGVEKKIAACLCLGTEENAKKAFDYVGPHTCQDAALIRGGYKMCKQGCLGYGDCVAICPVDAIFIDETGLPAVDRDRCISCEACVSACPHGIMQMVQVGQRVFIKCSNKEKGAITRLQCEVGCIGCGLCVKECPFDAIKLENNCAVIDYDKCKQCGKCVRVCPRKVIIQLPALLKK